MARFFTLLICSLFATGTAFADVTPEGTWKGEYVCKKTVRSIVIKLGAFDGKAADGELEFFTPPGADKPVRGSFKVRASHDAKRGRLRLKAGDWISRPDRYNSLNFQSNVNPDDGTLTGKLGRRCKLQGVVRTTPPVERLVVAAPKVDKPVTTAQAVKKSPLSALAPSRPGLAPGKWRDGFSIWPCLPRT